MLVPSGALFSLFDGVALSLIPVFLVRTLGVDNYALVGAAASWCWSRGPQPDRPPRLRPDRAIGWGLAAASVVSLGVVAAAPAESVGLALAAVAATGAAAGLVFKGGLDLCTQIAPVEDRGKLISSYYVACYLGGFSVPLLVIGALSDLMGLTAALAVLSGAAALGAAWTWAVGLRSLSGLRAPGRPP